MPAQSSGVRLTIRGTPSSPRALSDQELLAIYNDDRADLSLLSPGEHERLLALTAPAPVTSAPAANAVPRSAFSRLGSNAWEQVSPVAMVKGVAHAVRHPIDTGKAIVDAQLGQYGKAGTAYGEGRLTEAAGHLVAGALPVIGPAAAAAGEQIAEGDVAGGFGKGLGLVGSIFAPRIVKAVVPARAKVRILPRRGVLRSRLNPTEAAAVQAGEAHGIPIDAATATGNRFVRGAQRIADESLLGSISGARARETAALTRRGRELTEQANATRRGRAGAPADQVSAGEAVTTRLERRINAQARVADRAYDELRQLEAQQAQRIAQTGGVRAPATSAQPFTDVPLAVDVAAAKQALRPVYDRLVREQKLVGTLQGGKARTLVAIDALMNGPEMAPLSVVDGALGDLKAMARTGDLPALRTQGQATAAEAVKALEAQVTAAARAAGPAVYHALQRGRQATIGKYQTAAARELLNVDEPAQVFRQLTQQKDLGLERLRTVAEHTPREIPKIARAYLEGLLETATKEGGFAHADRLWSDWKNLGPETKKLLFRDPNYIKDLDNFFLLAKKMSENPNPSGSGFLVTKAGELTWLMSDPVTGGAVSLGLGALSKALHSPRAVRALTRGATVSARHSAARATGAGVFGQMTRGPVAATTAAESRERTPATSAQRR